MLGRLVDQQEVGGGSECPGEEESPAFASRNRRRLGAQDGVDAVGKLRQPRSQPRFDQQLGGLLFRHIPAGNPQVLQDARREQVGVLGRQRQRRRDFRARDEMNRPAAEQDRPRLGLEHSGESVEKRRLAYPRRSDDGEGRAALDCEGPGEVTAADITPPAGVEIHNPDLHIATLNDKGKIEIDLTVERGRGYVSAAQNKGEEDEIGRIPIDSIYSPVLKVSYKVEATRVAQRTDFDKLVVDVEVKPSTTPRDALASAGKTLVELFGLCVELNNEVEGIELGPPPVVETQSSDLQRPITILNLPARSQNCLQREGIRTIGELIQRSEADLLDIRNFGAKSIEDVKDELLKLDLRLKDSPAGFVSSFGEESYTMQFSDDSQG